MLNIYATNIIRLINNAHRKLYSQCTSIPTIIPHARTLLPIFLYSMILWWLNPVTHTHIHTHTTIRSTIKANFCPNNIIHNKMSAIFLQNIIHLRLINYIVLDNNHVNKNQIYETCINTVYSINIDSSFQKKWLKQNSYWIIPVLHHIRVKIKTKSMIYFVGFRI